MKLFQKLRKCVSQDCCSFSTECRRMNNDASSESQFQQPEKIVEEPTKTSVLELWSGENSWFAAEKEQSTDKCYYCFSGQIGIRAFALLVVLLVAFVPLLFKIILVYSSIFYCCFWFFSSLFLFLELLQQISLRKTTRTYLPWLPNMQPSEFFKLGYIFFMSYWITKRKVINDKRFLLQLERSMQ